MAKFYKKVFFPYLKEHNIDTIIDLGDSFEHRKFVNFNALAIAKDCFYDPIEKNGYKFHIIVGNHNAYFKNTNEVNSPQLLFDHYQNFYVYDRPSVIELDSRKILLQPWICADNSAESFDLIEKTDALVCLGHLELSGFEMYKGQAMEHGLGSEVFDKFDLVCSGHYHHKSTKGNINYLGCPYEMTWSDYGDQKGFHILDTDTLELEFIPNPYSMFNKVHYDDSNTSLEEINELDFSHLNSTFVKVIVRNKNNPYWFDMFMDKLEKSNPQNVQIVEDNFYMNLENDEEILNETEDTLTLLQKFVDTTDVSDKNKVQKFIQDLYLEATSIS